MRESPARLPVSLDVSLAPGGTISLHEGPFPAPAGTVCRKALLDAALADALLSMALRGLAVRVAMSLSSPEVGAV